MAKKKTPASHPVTMQRAAEMLKITRGALIQMVVRGEVQVSTYERGGGSLSHLIPRREVTRLKRVRAR